MATDFCEPPDSAHLGIFPGYSYPVWALARASGPWFVGTGEVSLAFAL